jgi:zinc protease
MSRRIAVLVATLALIACGKGSAPKTPATDALVKVLPMPTREVTLANGLRVIVQEDRQTSEVAVQVVYRVGGAHDPPGRSGFAHLFEHLMFEGSKHVPRGDFDRLLISAGVSNKNAHTTQDLTAYYETLPASQLELALFLESDRMGFLLDTLSQNVLDDVRAVVKNEYRQRYDTTPYGKVHLTLLTKVFPESHPYHRAPIGTLAELDAASLEDVRRFFLRWYGPNNATLVVVGNVKADETIAAARKWFEKIPASPSPPEIPKLPVVPNAKETRLSFSAGVRLPRLTMMWPTPAYGEPGDVELTSAAGLLQWTLSSQLIKKTEIAHSVFVAHWPGLYGGFFRVDVLLREGITMERAIEETDSGMDDLSRYARWSIDEKTVREALYGLYADNVFDLDGLTNRAETFGFFAAMTGSASGLGTRLRAFEAIDPSNVTDAFRDHVLRVPRVIAFVVPVATASPGGDLEQTK